MALLLNTTAAPGTHNKARRPTFTQFVRSSVKTALLPSTVAAQKARDETKATALERLVHCCTVLGYSLAQSGVLMVAVMWLSTWDWVHRDESGAPSMSNVALAALIGGVLASAHTLVVYCNIACCRERPGQRGGPRYARWVLATGALMCPLGYGWLRALEHMTGINAWYSLVHPPTLFVWAALFLIIELGGRQKWADHDRRNKRHENNREYSSTGEGQGGTRQVVVAQLPTGSSAAASEAAQPKSSNADTIATLIIFFSIISVCALCKCSRGARKCVTPTTHEPQL